MKRAILGVVLATVVLFLYGSLFWGVNPLPCSAWQQTNGDEAAGMALREHFPTPGTYYLPGRYNDEETLNRLYTTGPVALLHIAALDGLPMIEPSIMGKGLLLNLAMVLILAAILRSALPVLPTYGSKVKLAALIGLAAAVLIDGGQAVWWRVSVSWQMHLFLYDLTAFVVAALVLAPFIRPDDKQAG